VFNETGGARGMDTKICILKHILGYSSGPVKSINRTIHKVSKFRVFKNKILDFRRFEFKTQDPI
jgi:hypothetical protein